MSERRDEQERGGGEKGRDGAEERAGLGNDDVRDRGRDRGLAGASYGSNERDQTRAREQVRQRAVDEIGEIPNADADVEAGVSRRAERFED